MFRLPAMLRRLLAVMLVAGMAVPAVPVVAAAAEALAAQGDGGVLAIVAEAPETVRAEAKSPPADEGAVFDMPAIASRFFVSAVAAESGSTPAVAAVFHVPTGPPGLD